MYIYKPINNGRIKNKQAKNKMLQLYYIHVKCICTQCKIVFELPNLKYKKQKQTNKPPPPKKPTTNQSFLCPMLLVVQ